MENWRLSDPEYIDFDPTTVQEAILKFRRMQGMGLKPWMYPEAMVSCARKLRGQDMERFESWLICPGGEPNATAMDVRDFAKAQQELDAKHGRNALPAVTEDDEKCDDSEVKCEESDEKCEDVN